MSPSDASQPGREDGTPDAAAPRAAEPPPSPAGDPDTGPDPTGLDLARSVARSLSKGPRVDRRRRAPRAGERRRRTDARASGSHPDDRDPQTLDSTIGRLISEQGWSTDVRVHGVFSRWEHLVGRDVALHCSPESFADGKLAVRTDSTAWATQMRLLAPTVLRRLNEELGEGTVTLIDVHPPTAPSWRKGRRSVRGGRGPRDTYG